MSEFQKVATLSQLKDWQPTYVLAGEVELVVIRFDDQVSVLLGRCLDRGTLMSGVHNWDYRIDSGVLELI